MQKNWRTGLAGWLLSFIYRDGQNRYIAADLDEEAADIYGERGKIRGNFWFFTQLLKVFAGRFANIITWSIPIFASFMKIAVRNILLRKGISFIHISGLAIGFACCILLLTYAQDELSFDKFHEKNDRIFRLGSDLETEDGGTGKLSTNAWPAGRMLAADYAEIEEMLYMRSGNFPVKHGGSYFFDKQLYADRNFFRLFSFDLTSGDSETALEKPFTTIISRNIKEKYFGNRNPMGSSLLLADTLEFTITGVVDVPENSHIQFDMLLSFQTYLTFNPDAGGTGGWGNFNMTNYLLLKEGTDVMQFREKIRDFPMRKAGDMFKNWGMTGYQVIESMEDIYLRSDRGNHLGPSGSIRTIYFMLIIAALLMLIGCFNFINLSTARSVERAKEVGLRKVVGSTRERLVKQFLTEYIVICFAALIGAIIIISLTLPVFNNLTEKQYVYSDFLSMNIILLSVSLSVVVALVAGLYPASIISGYKPSEVLKGKFSTGTRGALLRKILVTAQFIITSLLIFCTLTVHEQLNFMLNKDLGFNKDQIVVMNTARIPYSEFISNREVIKNALLEHPGIMSVTGSFTVPGRRGWGGQVCTPEGMPDNQTVAVEFIPVDYDYISTFGIQIIAGREFSKEMSTDENNALLINESSVKLMGWNSPEHALGKMIDSPSGYPKGIVVGVIRDYNHHSLHKIVNPIVLDAVSSTGGLIALKFSAENTTEVLAGMQQEWQRFFPGYPFSYFFLDEFFARQYSDETRTVKLFSTFAVLAILVACSGLFGLIAFSTSQKTKEIGIRKTLGASSVSISVELMKDYLKLVIAAFLISLPAGYLLMDRWLEDFAYRINISAGTLLLTSGITVIIALLTVSFRTMKAALANPVNSLRNE